MRRPLPTESEAREILTRRRTRPQLRPPPPAGRSLAPLIKKLDAQFGRGVSALERNWFEIVGERLVGATLPIKLIKARGDTPGILELRVASAVAFLIPYEEKGIVERVNLALGPKTIGKVRITQGPVKPLPVAGAKPRARGKAVLPPLPASVEAELANSVEDAPDSLKAALRKLGRAVLSQPPENERR
ncbi:MULTISPECIES: DUF721 domain-containing protein [unclassified Brevundimonas]|uniref:DUF721 domain-containing protein n=1 Tax=unclassified Brevundimonas TaxID=2622653 RepID=UPI0025BD734B|nr:MULTISPECIES: DciA family protein [unclassified Brevundimonas]